MLLRKIFFVVLFLNCLGLYKINAQTVSLIPILGDVVICDSNPLDTSYVAQMKVTLSDSVSLFTKKIRLVVLSGASLLQDVEYSISEISSQPNALVWKELNSFYISVPNYNPLIMRKYLVELLDEGGVLLYQYDQDL